MEHYETKKVVEFSLNY